MSFADEIRNYTEDDLELIISTQQDMYSAEEMDQLKALLAEKRRESEKELEEKRRARLPEIINCDKCDGPNPFTNHKCDFCGQVLDKAKYYTDEYYEMAEDEEVEEVATQSSGGSHGFHYIISFLIPLIGYIMGAIMLASDDEYKRSCGKACIILAIISSILSVAITCFWWLV